MTKKPTRAFSIRIFLPDGDAAGLKVVEKSNWSGRGIVCPRSLFPQSKRRDEFMSTGVYVLVGTSDAGDVPMIYIGQGDPIRPRLESHYAKKGFWNSVVFFVSKDDHLNKAHIQHLESRLITLAKEADRAELDNQNTPILPSLSEMDAADAEGFLDEVLLCLPILGINYFAKPSSTRRAAKLFLKGSEAEAGGYESPDGFVVLAGARARITEVTSIHKYVGALRKSLVEREILVLDSDHYRLTKDYTFNSPSQAAAALMARNANGRIEWKNEDGRTLKELQEEVQTSVEPS